MVEEKEISVKEIINQENQQEEEKAKWWIIRVKSGKEDLVKAEIEKLAQQESKIKEVFTPEEEQKVKRKDKKGEEKEVLIKKKLISGYVYVKMELDEQLWNKIRKIPNVIALLGERGFPLPISSEKIESLQNKTAAGEIRRIFSLSIGDRVRIKSGPLKGFAGIVEWLNEDKSKARILISIFGRQTPVEIETSQVEKET